MESLLGSGWSRREIQYGPLRAGVGPLVSIVVVGGITAALWAGARSLAAGDDVDTDGRRGLFKKVFVWVLDLLGPTGVLVLGGVIVLALLWWLVARVKDPPLMAVISRR